MGLGILEPAGVEHVPGTVFVYNDAQRDAELLARHQVLKRNKNGTRILVPQPSSDPNDPLVKLRINFIRGYRLIAVELACVATRPNSRGPLLRFSRRYHSVASPRCRLYHACSPLRKDI